MRADKPIWALGGAACARVRYAAGSCNHIQARMIPTCVYPGGMALRSLNTQ